MNILARKTVFKSWLKIAGENFLLPLSDSLNDEKNELIKDRVLFKEFLKSHNIKHPNYWVIDSFKQCCKLLLHEKYFPILIKTPKNLSHTKDFFKVNSYKEFLRVWEEKDLSKKLPLLVEYWEEGEHFQFNFIDKKNVIFAKSVMSKQAGNIIQGWEFPALFPTKFLLPLKEILSVLKRYIYFPYKLNFVINKKGIHLISVNRSFLYPQTIPFFDDKRKGKRVLFLLLQRFVSKKLLPPHTVYAMRGKQLSQLLLEIREGQNTLKLLSELNYLLPNNILHTL